MRHYKTGHNPIKDNKASWLVFGLFTALLFCQTLLFDYFAFRGETGYSLYSGWEVTSMVFCKLGASMLFASFVFLLRDKRWILLLSFVIDTWMVANLIYMRNNHILLDAEAFNMSGNLHGYFWSVLIYIEWGIDLLFYGLTAVFGLVFLVIPKKTERLPWWWIGVIGIAVFTRLAGEGVYVLDQNNTTYDPFPYIREHREPVYGTHFPRTVQLTSILYSPLYIITDYYLMVNDIQPTRPLTEQDMQTIAKIDYPATDTTRLDSPLIIVLVESLENWVVTPEIMPNLYRLINNEHVFYANRVHTQIVGAPSADGQMIVNTGLLPINAGGTCLHYDHNTYPAIMKLAPEKAVCLLPHDTCVWNQTHMSPAYGYDTTICYTDIDTILFRKLDSLVDDGIRYIQCITQSTHAPFVNEQYSSLELPKDMPWVMYNFIRGFNALDEGLGYFIRKIETDPKLQQYTIVITGDHRILHYEKRQQMQAYADAHHMNLEPANDCLPVVIYSPKIRHNTRYTGDAYQMDIFPTYKALIGAKDYHWHGFGVNLMDPDAKRLIPEDEAYLLSDKIIRNNYFAH
jgi:phosphoglycerol transferase MdoB-like AlkP superfamily enzyme